MLNLMLIAGARPNFMKVAPILRELRERYPGKREDVRWELVHTGQHYDYEMSKVFFEELEIPEPDEFLNAGPGSHAEQTAKVMVAFEQVCLARRPDMVVVVGDVNSTLACAVTAKKMGVRVAHVEAGLRSGDWTMPEEINRVVTDAVSDLLLVSERSGLENLAREGKTAGVHFVGNVMIDTLFFGLEKIGSMSRPSTSRPPGATSPGGAEEAVGAGADQVSAGKPDLPASLRDAPRPAATAYDGAAYAVVTLHRPANVDERGALAGILGALGVIAQDMPVYFPIHPRTRKNLAEFGIDQELSGKDIRLLPPLSYLDFLRLWKDAALVLTDSGGIQEETTALGIPCFTIRDNTERPITVTQGNNILVGTSSDGILKAYDAFRNGEVKRGQVPELWDGRAAARIVDVLVGER